MHMKSHQSNHIADTFKIVQNLHYFKATFTRKKSYRYPFQSGSGSPPPNNVLFSYKLLLLSPYPLMSHLILLPSPSSAVPPPAAACSSILAFKSCCERRNLCCCGFSFPIFSNSASSSATCIVSMKFQDFFTSSMC